jgi:peptide chain release factor 2
MSGSDNLDLVHRLDSMLRRVEQSSTLSAGESDRLSQLRQRLDDAAVLLELALAEDDADVLAQVGAELAVLSRSVTG